MTTPIHTSQHIVCHACGTLNRVPTGRDQSLANCGRCKHALATPAPVDIDDATFTRLRTRDTGAFIVDAWAPWCGPCRMMAPSYTAAAAALSGQARLFKLDVDQNQASAAALNVRSVPTLLAYAGGKLISQQAGALQGPALESWIRSTLRLKG
mgnify:CR=1 FL=1